MQIDGGTTETLRREITLCTEIIAAIRDKDYLKVFYSCFLRYVIFSMSERSQTDIDYERLGLWATFNEIQKQSSVLAPGELFTMENCLQYAIPSLVPNDITSVSSQQTQTLPSIQTILGLLSEPEDLWMPALKPTATGTPAFRSPMPSW